jgi:ribosome-binding factor A
MQTPKPPSRRLQRVSELLRREMSEIIRRDFAIEEVGLLTVNDVIVAPDLRTATAFVGFVGTKAQRNAAPERLESRAARIQQMLGGHLRLKWTPVVKFVLDDSVERGNRVLAILEEIEKPPATAPTPAPNPPGHPPTTA